MPAATDAPTVSVRVDDPPAVTEPGEKPPVTPDGAPPSENVTDCALPFVTAVPIVVGADAPWTTLTDPGDALIEKSFVATPTTGCAIRHELLSFENVDCIANTPDVNVTFCAPPVPPRPFHAHLSAFS